MRYCNNCGVNVDHASLIQEIKLEFGYGSSMDGSKIKFRLCEDCLLDMVEGFEKPPEGFMSNASISQALIDGYRRESVTEALYDDYEAYVCYPSSDANKLKYNANGAIGECI